MLFLGIRYPRHKQTNDILSLPCYQQKNVFSGNFLVFKFLINELHQFYSSSKKLFFRGRPNEFAALVVNSVIYKTLFAAWF